MWRRQWWWKARGIWERRGIFGETGKHIVVDSKGGGRLREQEREIIGAGKRDITVIEEVVMGK